MTAHDVATPARRGWRRAAAWLAVAAALGVVFVAYRSPDLVVDLANRLWACF